MNAEATGRVAYPGLRPFTRDEFDLFFGRENCVDEMVDTLAATRFLAVLGTSGSGKSSLVRTGLLNALELGFLAAAGSNWQIADLRPRGHPIRSLATALLGLQGNPDPDDGEIEILSAFLRRGPRSLIEWYEAGHLPEADNLVVLVDQFEELFRYEDYSGREEAEAFVALLIEAARETQLPLYVVITMRSEYLGACTLIESLPEMVNRGLYLTPRMSREECRQAIVGPAEVCGFSIEEALVNKLLNDLTDFAPWEAERGHDQRRRLGRRADQLPLMQHVLNLLWQRAIERSEESIHLTLADYEAAGGLSGALDRHADEVAAGIAPAHADVIDIVFRSLATGKSVVDAVRRPTIFGELVTLAGGRRESVAAVVDAFREPGINFLTPAPPEPLLDSTFIDISHESLIRQWQRLSHCLTEEAQSADAWNQLLWRSERYKAGLGGLLSGLDLDNLAAWWQRTQPTEAWANRYGNNYAEAQGFLEDSQTAEAERRRQEGEDQRKLIEAEEAARTGTRFKRLSGALAGAVVLAIIGAGAAVYLWREANQQATIATEQAVIAQQERQEAERQRQLADAQREEAERQRQLADQERDRAEEQAQLAEQERERAVAAAEAAEQSAAAARIAQTAAEQAREEAVAAREEAARANARLIAQQLANRVSALHVGLDQNPEEVTRAANLLTRAAEAGYVADPDDATVENATTVELLRPALAFQAMLATATIPETTVPGEEDATRWRSPPGGPGLSVLINWSFLDEAQFFRIIDPIGRIIARYPMPTVPTAYEKTPVAAATIGPDVPVGVLVTSDGNIWAAFGENGAFARYSDGMEGEVERIDDVRYDPVGERLYIAFAGRTPGSAESRPRLIVLGRQSADWSDWAKETDVELGYGTLGVLPPVRIAGISNGLAYVVAQGSLIEIDADSGGDRTYPGLGTVSDAILTVDGEHLVAGISEACEGLQFGARDDRREDILSPIPAAIVLQSKSPGIVDSAPAERLGCMVLIDPASGTVEWHGRAEPRTRLHAAYSRGGVDPTIEFVTEIVPPDYSTDALLVDTAFVPTMMWVHALSKRDGGWIETRTRFDPAEWVPAGIGADLAAAAATETAYPTALTKELYTKLFEARTLPRIAGRLENSDTVIASDISGNAFKAARISINEDGHHSVEVTVYQPENGAFIRDEDLTPLPVACRPVPEAGLDPCRFVAAGFSPDGSALILATSHGEHAVVAGEAAPSWRANTLEGESGRPVSSLIGFNALDRDGHAFVTHGQSGDLLLLRRPAPGDGGTSLARIETDDDLWQRVGAADGYTSDPSSGLIYVWGSNGLVVLSLPGDSGLQAERRGAIESNAIADVASLGSGLFVLATTDGHISLYTVEGDTLTERDSAETGLSSFGAIRLAAANGSVIANAGDAGNYWLRSVGYVVDGGRLKQLFALPWDHYAGQLANGELASVAFGAEVFAKPQALPPDDELLALTIMRERRQDDEAANEFRHVFQMLSLRPDGTTAAGNEPSCDTAIAVAARAEGDDEIEAALNLLRRVCRLSPSGQAIAEALALDGRDRVLALLQLAPRSQYALAMLARTLKQGASEAAAALEASEPWLAHLPTEASVAVIAGGAPVPPELATAYTDRTGGGDPYDNWLLAVIAERGEIGADRLAAALRHYALAERQFRAAGRPVPAQVVARRIAAARILADDIVIEVFRDVMDGPTGGSGAVEAGSPASLQETADWLRMLQGAGPAGDGLNVLVALVEEALGDELAKLDPVAAADHYRRALTAIAASPAVLSAAGVMARIAEIDAIRDKLGAAGASDADAAAAGAVLEVADSEIDGPDVGGRELRERLTAALRQLVAAGGGVDFRRFDHLRLAFLDHDWESRFQAIDRAGATGVETELAAAEAFLTAALATADGEVRARLLGLRGATRFWLSTLADEDMPAGDAPRFDRWLEGSIADLDAIGGAALSPWDAVILGSAHSRALSRAPDDADMTEALDAAVGAFERALDDPRFDELPEYRRRLVFDGYALALERALDRVRRDPLLAGTGPHPGDATYDRDRLAERTFEAFALAARREEVRARAGALGLLRDGSNWSLDTVGDYYWGFTAAQAGALLRLESGANGSPTECDRLAAHPHDVLRTTRPVGFAALDMDKALAACVGDSPRDLFNRARALSKGAARDQGEIPALLVEAAQAGLPIAYNNLSILVDSLHPDFVSIDDLQSTFAALTLRTAYPEFSRLFRDQARDDGRRDTFAWLAAKAAALDVPEAHRDLADLAEADRFARAVHLAAAEELFAADGRREAAELAASDLAALNLSKAELDRARAAAAARERTRLVILDDEMASRLLGLW